MAFAWFLIVSFKFFVIEISKFQSILESLMPHPNKTRQELLQFQLYFSNFDFRFFQFWFFLHENWFFLNNHLEINQEPHSTLVTLRRWTSDIYIAYKILTRTVLTHSEISAKCLTKFRIFVSNCPWSLLGWFSGTKGQTGTKGQVQRQGRTLPPYDRLRSGVIKYSWIHHRTPITIWYIYRIWRFPGFVNINIR